MIDIDDPHEGTEQDRHLQQEYEEAQAQKEARERQILDRIAQLYAKLDDLRNPHGGAEGGGGGDAERVKGPRVVLVSRKLHMDISRTTDGWKIEEYG